MNDPLVSVLIPTRNRLALLHEALVSAREQTYRRVEILVSDDGSDDGTVEWVRTVAKEDPRVVLVPRNPEPGLFENLNHLAGQARGDAFFFLADDDRLLPEGIANLVAALKREPSAQAVTGEYWEIDTLGMRDETWTTERIAGLGRATLPAGLWNDAFAATLRTEVNLGASLFRRTSLQPFVFDLSCGGAADVELWIRVAERNAVAYVPDKITEIRLHPGQASAHRNVYMARGIVRALEIHPQRDPKLDQGRLRMLQRNRASLALLRSTVDRWDALRSVADYLRDAPGYWDLRGLSSVGYSAGLALLPQPFARFSRKGVSSLLQHIRSTPR
jgi:glycosyltransferase involved in cell wall biosynthesis